MMIAQTGLASPSLPDNPASNSSGSDAFSWLIPVLIGVFLTVLFLRLTRFNTKNQSLAKETNNTKSATGKSPETSSKLNADDSSGGNRDRGSGRSNGSKKNKKSRSNRHNDRVTNATVTIDDSSEKPTTKVATKSKKDRLREQQLAYVQSTVQSKSPAIPSSSQTTTPVNPIFEPLRDVGALRRSVQSAKPVTSIETLSSDKAPVVQPSSGKFERIIASTVTTQSSANRWPAPVIQTPPPKPFATSEPETKEPESKPRKPAVAADVTLNTPSAEPAPRQGLKSFVSKVKSASASSAIVAEDVD
jgi:hypothetical protein